MRGCRRCHSFPVVVDNRYIEKAHSCYMTEWQTSIHFQVYQLCYLDVAIDVAIDVADDCNGWLLSSLSIQLTIKQTILAAQTTITIRTICLKHCASQMYYLIVKTK